MHYILDVLNDGMGEPWGGGCPGVDPVVHLVVED